MAGPRVFISYSHDSEAHREAVLQLSQCLREGGIDAQMDRFVAAPDEGWSRWMTAQLDAADFVILACTAAFRRRFEGLDAAGKGQDVTFEGLLAIQHLHDANTLNTKLIPVILEGATEADVPLVLRPYSRYVLPAQYEALYRHLTAQPEVVAAPLGPRQRLPPRLAVTTSVALKAAPTLAPRTALLRAQIRSEGSDGVRIEPAELLHRLLLSLFTSGDSFRQWMSLGPDGPELVAEFPSGTASTSATIFGGLDILRRHGHIDAGFFERLHTKFPRRRADIARAATAWGASSHPPGSSARPSPAPGTVPRLAPFPGPLGQVFLANQERAELDIVGDRDGDVLRLRFHLHNDAALVHSCDVPGVAAVVQQVRERGPALDGAAALAIGQALTTLLFGLPGEAAYHRLFRSLFRQPDEPALRIGPARRPVRCRLHFSDPELRALPWSLLAEDGHWLADDGWLFELAGVEVARNHAQVHLQAPCTTLLIVPDIGQTATFNPAQHRDDLVALLADLWRKVVDQHLLSSHILTANTWSKVQDLARRADVVYVCAQASDHGGRWTLRLDRPKGAQEDVRLDLFLRELRNSAKIVYLNVAAPRSGALMPALCDLPGPQAVIAPWTAGFGPEAEAGGRQWLRALLGEGHDPVSALHVVTREQASARAGTMQVMTRYRGWRTTPAPAELYTGRARLHVDRRNQRLRFWDLLQNLARHETRRVEAVIAYGEASHGIAALPDLLEQHVEDACDQEVRATIHVVRDRLLLPEPRHDLETYLHDVVCSALNISLGGTLGGALTTRFTSIRTDRGARKILWIDWGVVGTDGPLLRSELLAWLRYHVQRLGAHCPAEGRIVATLCVAASAPGCRKLGAFLERGVPDDVARTATASYTALPELHPVQRNDLVDYLEHHSSCPSCQIGAVADALLHATGGRFEAIVERIEAVEHREQTWDRLAGTRAHDPPEPLDDEEFR